MEFENVNNFNILLEASLKRRKPRILFGMVHRIKKWLRQAKPDCTSTRMSKTEEELDNDINEILEAKRLRASLELDMRPFCHITGRQSPEAQVP